MQDQQTIAPAAPIAIVTSLDERLEKCSWCWERAHPDEPHPEAWSSTVCPECEAELDAQIAKAKAKVHADREARRIAALAALVANPTDQQRQDQCIWCWYEQHSGEPYPFGTSSMCVPHKQGVYAARTVSRAQKGQEVIVV